MTVKRSATYELRKLGFAKRKRITELLFCRKEGCVNNKFLIVIVVLVSSKGNIVEDPNKLLENFPYH